MGAHSQVRKNQYILFRACHNADVLRNSCWGLKVLGVYAGAKSNNEAGVHSKHVGKNATSKPYLQDPRQQAGADVGVGASRALGWTSNTGNYYGADGSQGTVLNVNMYPPPPFFFSLSLITYTFVLSPLCRCQSPLLLFPCSCSSLPFHF